MENDEVNDIEITADELRIVGAVDGTDSDDEMRSGYSDLEGDEIDGADEQNDLINGHTGNDVIDGGPGNDTIFGDTGLVDEVNLIVNGTFDTDRDGWDRTNGTVTVENGAVVLERTEEDSRTKGLSQFISTERDTLYNLTMTLSADNTTEPVTIVVEVGFRVLEETFTLVGNETISVDLEFLAGGTSTEVQFYTATDTPLNNAVRVDDVSVSQVNYFNKGNDAIDGGIGDDLIVGGAGDDTLTGGEGNDTVLGGEGDDTFIIDGYLSSGGDTMEGGDGIDTLIISGDTEVGAIWIGLGGVSTGDFEFSNIENVTSLIDGDVTISSNVNDDTNNTITTGDGNDRIAGGGGSDTITSGAGDDEIYTRDGDQVDAGLGDDLVAVLGSDDFESDRLIDGGAGTDTLILDLSGFGGYVVDLVEGTIETEDGSELNTVNFENVTADNRDDIIVHGFGANIIDGGSGDDTFVVQSAEQGAGDTVAGGLFDTDTLDLRGVGAITLVNASDLRGGQNGTVYFASGDGFGTADALTYTNIDVILTDEAPNGAQAMDDINGPILSSDLVDDAGEIARFAGVNFYANDSSTAIITSLDGDDRFVEGWQGWMDASNGGQISVNLDGRAFFRDRDGEFAFLREGETVETSIEYSVGVGDGATANITFIIEGTCTNTIGDDVNAPVEASDLVDFDGSIIRINGTNVLANDVPEANITYVNGMDVTSSGWQGWMDASNGGQISLNTDGRVQFRDADGDFSRLPDGETVDTTLAYSITDVGGNTYTATITFTVIGTYIPDPEVNEPILASELIGTDDQFLKINGVELLVNDDSEKTIVAVNGIDVTAEGWLGWMDASNGGQISINTDGRVQFRDPYDGFAELLIGETVETSITYTISDIDGATETKQVSFFIEGTFDPTSQVFAEDDLNGPIAISDLYDGETVFRLNGENILANDSSADQDTLRIAEIDGITVYEDGWFGWLDASNGGQISINTDGRVQFRDRDSDFVDLAPGEAIDTSLIYELEDTDGDTDTATVTFTIVGDGLPDATEPDPAFDIV